MNAPHGLCPECLARVLPDWSVCKFCGHNLVGVVPAPWQEPEPDKQQSTGGSGPGAGASFFELYGDFDTTTPAADEREMLPMAEGGSTEPPDGMLALPPAPGDETSTIPDVSPYDLPYDDSDEPARGSAGTVAGGAGHSLFGGRDDRPDEAPTSAATPPSADDNWWMHSDAPPGSPAPPPSGGAAWSEPDQPFTRGPSDSAADWEDSGVSFEPSSWEGPQSDPAMSLARLEAPATILPPASKPPLVSREFRLLAMAIVFLLVILVGWVVVDNSTKTSYPNAWDGRITSLARYVSSERELGFTHAVKVRFLSAQDYREQVADEAKHYRLNDKEAEREAAEFRALGISASGSANVSAMRPDLDSAAFYSFRSHTLYVRGVALTPKLKAEVVHQLTHALEDQHFDTGSLQSPKVDSLGLWAVAEGDAATVERLYVEQLSPADRAAYDADKSNQEPAAPAGLWDVLAAEPARAGALFGRVIQASGGWQLINQALSFAPSSDAQFFDPFRYLDGDRALHVDQPDPPEGAKSVVESSLGASAIYLVLANHIDPLTALAAADAWGGDAMLTYRDSRDVTCVSLRVRGAADADRTIIERAFTLLRDELGSSRISVKATGDLVDVTGCDPGANGVGTDRSADTSLVPMLRTRMAIDLYDEIKEVPNGVNGPILSLSQTRCVAQNAISDMPTDRLLSLRTNPLSAAEEKAATDAATPLCKGAFTPSSGAGTN